jgi:hypothetical protein
MPLWNLIKNTIIEAIDTVLEGLEPYEYATLPTKTSIRLLSFERDHSSLFYNDEENRPCRILMCPESPWGRHSTMQVQSRSQDTTAHSFVLYRRSRPQAGAYGLSRKEVVISTAD